MTLILTYLTESTVLQVADRLVTSNGQPVDTAANKSLLFFAKDAIVSVGYSGLAEIEKLPADHWIAQALSGEEIPIVANGAPWTTTRFPPPKNWPTIGTALDRLQARLESVFAQLPGNRRPKHQVILAGWQRRNKRAHPVAYEIFNGESRSDRHRFRRQSLPRYWHYERNRDGDTGNELHQIRLWWIPDSNPLRTSEFQVLMERLSGSASLDEAQQHLVDAVRAASWRSRVVGRDCLSVLMPTPGNRKIVVFYHSGRPAVIVAGHLPRAPGFVPTYGPWILSPSLIQPPQIATGPYATTIGSFVVEVVGPPTSTPIDYGDGTRLLGMVGPQPRPRWEDR